MSRQFRLISGPERAYLWRATRTRVPEPESPEPESPELRRSMMDAKVATAEPFVREAAAGSTLNVLGVTHIYKATGAETGGSFSLWEAVFPPGAGAPPHTHEREDEAFYVLSGEIELEFEGEPAPRRI